MPKKIVISLLILMLIPSLYAYFKLLQYSLEPASTQQSSSIQIVSKEKNEKDFDSVIKDQKTSKMDAENSAANTNSSDSVDDKESKPVAHLEVLGTIKTQKGEGIAGVLILGKGEFPPTYSDANGQYHIVFQKSGISELILNFSLNGYEKLKSLINIDAFEKSPILTWDVTLTEALDTLSTTSFGGKVSNLIGEGLANQYIHLITLGDYSDSEVRYIDVELTDKNGHFTLSDVSINTYYQLVVLAGNGYKRIELDDFLVTDDTQDVDIILEYTKLINKSGLVIDREGVPLPNLKISANNIVNSNVNGKYSKNLVTDNSGGFQLENFPEGEVAFSIESPANIKISGIKLSEMDSQTIILTVDSGNHFLSGLVSDSDGQTIQNARVTMQSTYSKNGVNSHSVRSVTTDSTGAFAFESFGADEHIISIISKGYKQQMIVHQPHSSDTNLNIILERR